MDMKGKRFATVEEVKQKSLEGLKNIPISEFKKCFAQWEDSFVEVRCGQGRIL